MQISGPKPNNYFHNNPKTRDFIIASTNKIIRGKKRAFPTNRSCEICHYKPLKKLDYHHWDDSKPIRGLWVCGVCHKQIHKFENGEPIKQGRFSWEACLDRYLKLKKEIDAGKNLLTKSRRQLLSLHQKIMANAIFGLDVVL